MKNIKNFTQWKNESVDVMFMPAITHQKHLAQSGRSTRSAVDIFNTLRIRLLKNQSENKKLSWSVWIANNTSQLLHTLHHGAGLYKCSATWPP